MQIDKYIRLAFVLNNNQAKTLYRNLEKMISLVLYEAQDEFDSSVRDVRFEGLEVVDIIDRLKNSYGLDFSENEVLNVINKEGKAPIFICISNKPKKFALVPNEIEKLRNRIRDDSLEKVISNFAAYENNAKSGEEEQTLTEAALHGKNFSEEEIKDVLYRYFYTLFNSNASYIRSFLGQRYDTVKLSDSEFNTSDKSLINDFVYWKNPEKDKIVYEMVSCCLDYCMLTVKKDTATYQTVFNNKVFYLDTNVIYRLIGINRENRKKIIDAFVKKCQSVGIKLKVTNFTREEIEGTIDRNVSKIRAVLNGREPISTTSISYYASSALNPDFYDAYREWCKSNDYKDYSAFARELKRKAISTISQYNITYEDGESLKEKPDYSDTVESLISYKQNANRNSNKYAAEVDVNNYLFVRQKNSKRQSSDFFNTHHYLISADHAFGDWAREKIPNGIPFVVLPSVWYSIILQYAGRNTDNDYAAFTRFLNFSIENGERKPEGIEKTRLAVLERVLSLNESSQFKDAILFDVQERFNGIEPDADYFDDVDAIVEEGLESVEASIRAEERDIAEKQRETDKANYQTQMNRVTNKYEIKVDKLKAENIRLQNESEKEINNAVKKAKSQYIEEETNRRTRNTLILYWLITIGLVAILCAITFSIFVWVEGLKEVTKQAELKYDFFKYIVTGGAGIVSFLVIKNLLCGLNSESIRKKVKERVINDHPN